MEMKLPQLMLVLYVNVKKNAFKMKLSPFIEEKVCQVSKPSHIHSISICRHSYSMHFVTGLFH